VVPHAGELGADRLIGVFAYVHRMSQQVVDNYEEERERWLETRNSLRALRVEKC
jgi:hypothetical protein